MKPPVSILHLTHDMGIGGTEQVIRQLVSTLDTGRWRCSILCLDGHIGALGRQLQNEGIPVDTLHRRPGLDLALIGALRRGLRARAVDILHCHQYTPFVYGVLACLGTPTRVVYTEHGRFHPDRHSWKRRLVNPLLNHATDAVTAISAATRDALVRYEWFSRRSIRVIHNGLVARRCATPASEAKVSLGMSAQTLVFTTIARLDTIKNQRMMIDAFAEVHRAQPGACLLIVGDGPERQRLEAQAAEAGVAAAVRFEGFQTDIDRYLAATDIFLLSSLSEGTSMTLLEAMSCARPCVVTAVGGNVELLVHGSSALLTPSMDTHAFAEAMQRLASDASLRLALGSAAREEFMARFDIQHMIDAYQGLYDGIVPAHATADK